MTIRESQKREREREREREIKEELNLRVLSHWLNIDGGWREL